MRKNKKLTGYQFRDFCLLSPNFEVVFTCYIMNIKIVNSSPYPLPAYATVGSAGMDIYAHISEPYELLFLERTLVPTGIYIELPEGYEAQIRPRSGLALKHGITIINAPSTIDSDYRGELKIALINLSKDTFLIEPGMRIAQMVVAPFVKVHWEEVTVLNPSERGSGGFGHTGV